MIISNLQKVAVDKGYNRAKLNRAADISYPVVFRLWKPEPLKQIDANVLDRLCAVLDCEPGDIIKRIVPQEPHP